ncbi:Divalent-cation tolerance protein CutA [Gammaproteobacteria bacterium]
MSSLIVLCTCPDTDSAGILAAAMVNRGLAACVNILPNMRSIYRWHEMIETATECMLVIKTHASVYSALESAITELHPYKVPEILALPIHQGLPAYLDWIAESVTPEKEA